MPKQARTLNDRELQKLLEFVSKKNNARRNRTILLLTHYSGMRIGEIAALRYCDVVAPDGTIHNEIYLSANQTKGDRGRTVLINERMRGELAAYAAGRRIKDTKLPLFPTQRSAGFSANSLTQVINSLYKQAGFHGCSSHSGRRGYLSKLSELGTSARVMMALVGHKNMSTTQKYIDLRPGVLRNAVELI